MATFRMIRFSTVVGMSRSLAALLSVMLILSAWLHAAPGYARDLPANNLIFVESGDHGLMVLPREVLEQRSREDDGSAGGPPAAFDADLSTVLLPVATPTSTLPDAWHVPQDLHDPSTNPASPRAPPFPLPL